MRKCTKCLETKSLDRFTRRKRGGQLNSWCRDCTVTATRLGRQNNPAIRQKNIDNNNRRRRELKTYVDQLKSEPCSDCKKCWKPWQMHFDHVRGKKFSDIATIVRTGARRRLEEELKKCELVCGHCHATRTHNRRHGVVEE